MKSQTKSRKRKPKLGAGPSLSKKPAEPSAQRDPAEGTLSASDGRRARRLRTEARLFSSLAVLLRTAGVAALGVNAVAEHADVEKVLIYRYFGGLEGLMAEYAKRSDFWPTVDEIIGSDRTLLQDPNRPRVAAKLLGNYARALRKRPVTLDLLAWECSHRNALTVALEAVREERSRELFAQLSAAGFPTQGAPAQLSALLSGAINYLVVRGRDLTLFAGLRVTNDEDWQHIEELIASAFRGVMPVE